MAIVAIVAAITTAVVHDLELGSSLGDVEALDEALKQGWIGDIRDLHRYKLALGSKVPHDTHSRGPSARVRSDGRQRAARCMPMRASWILLK